jgi:hypothetical protein
MILNGKTCKTTIEQKGEQGQVVFSSGTRERTAFNGAQQKGISGRKGPKKS